MNASLYAEKCYSYAHKDRTDIKSFKKLTGVSKAMLKCIIKHEGYRDCAITWKTYIQMVVAFGLLNTTCTRLNKRSCTVDNCNLLEMILSMPMTHHLICT
jgi:hypothetical protein